MKKVLVIGDEIKVHHVAENLRELQTASYNDNSVYCVNHPVHIFTKLYQSSEFSRLPDMFYKYAEVANVEESKDFNNMLTNYRATVEFIVDKNSVVGGIVQHYIDNSNESKIRKLNDEIDRLKLTNADLKFQIEREEVNNRDLIVAIEMVRGERDSLRNKHTEVTYTPTLKVIFELIKVWWVNKFTLK